ncbi:ABC transporter permease [Brooklawnia cerclae]|uniref:ABC transport system permease protein n=1 Tax=Brooklawnia cerclae TaxID=349934 RepID=A0ABX0SHJ0_9ACTN|nr:FtsX-like permease family protein [Brooklawnia cerclae]NIH57868.1 putative ABC transport system permease protein [Brooklawnia cerclae]
MNNRHKMYLRMITQSFWHRLSRVIIASLSIAVGAATLSGLGLVAYTVPAQMSKELRSYGANLIVLSDGSQSLTDAQLAAADDAVGDARLSRAPYQYTNLLYNQQALQVMGTIVDDAWAVRPYWEIDGELPSGPDQILVGENVAELYRFDVGETVGLTEPTVADGTAKRLTVSGILRTGGAEDDLIVMSLDTLKEFTGGVSEYNIIEYSVNADETRLGALVDDIDATDAGMDAEVVRRISQTQTGIAQTLQTLIWIVSVIICLLTLISISATLNAIVSERSREIGLKKALGALSRDVMNEFVGESVLLGLIGGVAGVAAGIWIANFISLKAFAVQLDINWWVVPITLVFSVVISLAGSLLPARRISRIRPADVLGGE